jgi:hypothetical protein
VVHLVHHEQVPVAAELGEMQVGRRGDALVGGDVAGEAAAGVARAVVGGADGEGMAEGLAPGGVGEGLLGLKAEAVARHHPADPLAEPGADQRIRGEDRQQRLAAARRDRGEDVAQPAGLARGDGLDDGEELALVAPERPHGLRESDTLES